MRFILESSTPITHFIGHLERHAIAVAQDVQEWVSVIDLPDDMALVDFLAAVGDRCSIYIRTREPYWPEAIPLVCIHVHNEPEHRVRITVEDL